jgi:nucleotide-binding universal stress UspA family protein
MLTGSNILVCTDFSANSETVLKVASALSIKARASLYAAHVCEQPMQLDWSANESMANYLNERFEVDLIDSSKKKLEQQLSGLGIQGEPHVTLGVPLQALQPLIQEKGINLLVMGHKGKGKTPFYLGGFASKIIASASVPVLIVKREMLTNRIAGLLDPDGPMDEIITAADELASIFSGPIEFVSLFGDVGAQIGIGKLGFSTKLLSLTDEERNEVIKNIRNRIRKELRHDSRAEIKVEITVEKKFAYHLNSILEGDHTDLAVMKRHQSGFLEKIIIGSVTRRMIEIFEGNLLILPP